MSLYYEFEMSVILSLITRVAFCPAECVDDLTRAIYGRKLDWLDDDIHQIVTAEVYRQEPQLEALIASPLTTNITPENCDARLAEVIRSYGDKVLLQPCY